MLCLISLWNEGREGGGGGAPASFLEHALDELPDERARGYVGAVDVDHVLLAPPGVDESLL